GGGGERVMSEGDVAGAIMAAREGNGIDLLLGIGGTPEGIIAACAVKCLGGIIQGKLAPRDDDERDRAIAAGHDLQQVLTTDDLVASEDAFFAATGITDGELVAGGRRDDPVAGHAGALGNHPHHYQRAPALEAARLQCVRLRQLLLNGTSPGASDGGAGSRQAVDAGPRRPHARMRYGPSSSPRFSCR